MENGLMNMISNVGFPIAISVALFYQLIKTNELVREFQSTIVKNTDTIGSLVDRIEEHNRKGD